MHLARRRIIIKTKSCKLTHQFTQQQFRNVQSSNNIPEHAIKYININNPQKRNALSLRVLEDLHSQFTQLLSNKGANDVPKVVILHSEGPVFCSGHDLKELQANDTQFHNQTFHLCGELMQLIRKIDQPVIAKIQGLATAAGVCYIIV
jgi:enoyl-CoA hydratase/carnithine racemase